MAGKTPEHGPTAQVVADNIKRLRNAQDLSYTQLSERLKSIAGWAISPVGVRRMEDGERRVGVDDLVALAVALRVTPATLLMPGSIYPDAPLTAAPTGIDDSLTARETWQWMTAEKPLPGMEDSEYGEFRQLAMPAWAAVEMASRIPAYELQEQIRQARDQGRTSMLEELAMGGKLRTPDETDRAMKDRDDREARRIAEESTDGNE